MDTHTHALITFNLGLWIWYAQDRIREWFCTPLAMIIAFILAVFGAMFPDSLMLYGYLKLTELESLHGPIQWDVWKTWWVQWPTTIMHSLIIVAIVATLLLVGLGKLRAYAWPFLFGWLIGHIGIDYLTHTENAHRYFWPLSEIRPMGLLSRFHPVVYGSIPILTIVDWILWVTLGIFDCIVVYRFCKDLSFKPKSRTHQ